MEKELIAQETMPKEVKKVSKSEMVRFVHDVKELEVKALTLEDTAKDCNLRANRMERNAENNLSRAEQNLKRAEEDLKVLPDEKKKSLANESVSVIVGGILGSLFGGAIVGLIIGSVIQASVNEDELTWGIIGAGLGAVIGVVIAAVCLSLSEVNDKKTVEELAKQLENKVITAKNDLVTATVQNEEAKHQVNEVRAHAENLEQAALVIRKQLASIYAVNIVPPRFRRLDCVALIDDVFVNDQADTMREATLLCDERIHREIVEESLKELAETMHGIRNVLEGMARDVSMMSQDVFRIAEMQSEMLSEAKSTRYAAEATAQAAERTAFYEQIRYAERR